MSRRIIIILRMGHRWKQKLESLKSKHVKTLAETISFNIMHGMKTERQASYQPNKEYKMRHTYTPEQHIALALALRQVDRNNTILKLLSAPNFALTANPRQSILYETMIANAVNKIANGNQNIYIPPNLEPNVTVYFHIDNIDWVEDTPDGKKY